VSLVSLKRYTEAKSVLRKTIPVLQHILGKNDAGTFKTRWCLATALYLDPGATFHDLREAVTTFEDTQRIARRVLGAAHPLLVDVEHHLRKSRAALRARETPSTSA
jgi:hypothetical protein